MNPWIVYGCFLAAGMLLGGIVGAVLMLLYMVHEERTEAVQTALPPIFQPQTTKEKEEWDAREEWEQLNPGRDYDKWKRKDRYE